MKPKATDSPSRSNSPCCTDSPSRAVSEMEPKTSKISDLREIIDTLRTQKKEAVIHNNRMVEAGRNERRKRKQKEEELEEERLKVARLETELQAKDDVIEEWKRKYEEAMKRVAPVPIPVQKEVFEPVNDDQIRMELGQLKIGQLVSSLAAHKLCSQTIHDFVSGSRSTTEGVKTILRQWWCDWKLGKVSAETQITPAMKQQMREFKTNLGKGAHLDELNAAELLAQINQNVVQPVSLYEMKLKYKYV